MVGLLDVAGNDGCEAVLAQHLARLLATGELPDVDQIRIDLAPRPALCPTVSVVLSTLASYDQLLRAA